MNSETNKPLVFFIDDDPLCNEINMILFGKLNTDIEITTYTNAEKALADLKDPSKKKPELIFLDLNMPVMSGWDFMEEYNKLGLKIEVVILTSSIHFADKEKADKEENVADFISKPLSKPSLMGFMKKILGK